MSSIATSLMTTLAVAALLATGCGKKDEAPAEALPPAEAQAPAMSPEAKAAREKYDTLCVACHGPDGTGNGPAAAALDPKPRNYQDAAWQAKISDEEIAKAIVEGGPAVGLSANMPPNPDLANQPEVVAELVKIVRAFGDAE